MGDLFLMMKNQKTGFYLHINIFNFRRYFSVPILGWYHPQRYLSTVWLSIQHSKETSRGTEVNETIGTITRKLDLVRKCFKLQVCVWLCVCLWRGTGGQKDSLKILKERFIPLMSSFHKCATDDRNRWLLFTVATDNFLIRQFSMHSLAMTIHSWWDVWLKELR